MVAPPEYPLQHQELLPCLITSPAAAPVGLDSQPLDPAVPFLTLNFPLFPDGAPAISAVGNAVELRGAEFRGILLHSTPPARQDAPRQTLQPWTAALDLAREAGGRRHRKNPLLYREILGKLVPVTDISPSRAIMCCGSTPFSSQTIRRLHVSCCTLPRVRKGFVFHIRVYDPGGGSGKRPS